MSTEHRTTVEKLYRARCSTCGPVGKQHPAGDLAPGEGHHGYRLALAEGDAHEERCAKRTRS